MENMIDVLLMIYGIGIVVSLLIFIIDYIIIDIHLGFTVWEAVKYLFLYDIQSFSTMVLFSFGSWFALADFYNRRR